jgi:rod shape-determining protein MreC
MLVLASLTVLSLDYHGEASRAITHVRNGVADALDPFQRALASAMHPFGDAVSAMFHYGQLETDNARLRSEVGQLSAQLADSNYASQLEAEHLELSNLPFAGNIATIPAEVIAGASSNFEDTIEIDRGTSSGVGKNEPVVANAGLIGTVLSASATTATVLLISDSRSTIEVQDERTGDFFQIQGSGLGRSLVLGPFGTSSGMASVGSELETTGQTNGSPATQFPAGLPVGRVASVHTSASGALRGAVTPNVDLSSLQFVAVLQWLPPA